MLLSSHSQFAGYVNIAELVKTIEDKGYVSESLIEFDEKSLNLVQEISADKFDVEECPAVIIQVVSEWVEALTEYYETDFDNALKLHYWSEDTEDFRYEYDNLIGDISGFIKDDSIYLYLGV